MRYLYTTFTFLIILSVFYIGYSEENSQPVEKEQNKPLKIAIFARNKTRNESYDRYADILKNNLISQLSGQFTIIDEDDVISIFEKEFKNAENKKSRNIGDFFSALAEIKEKAEEREGNINNISIKQKSSALRMSQMIGTDYILITDLEDVEVNNIRDIVYGNQINDLMITTEVAVKILDGMEGGSILAENIRIKKRLHGDEKTEFTKEDISQSLPILMKQAAEDISKKILGNIKKIKEFKKMKSNPVHFLIKTNVKNVTVELDGVMIGTAPGKLQALPGLHRIKLTKDGYRSFEKYINIFDNLVINVSLERIRDQ